MSDHREDDHSYVDQEACEDLLVIGDSIYVAVTSGGDSDCGEDKSRRVKRKRRAIREAKPVDPAVIELICPSVVDQPDENKHAGETMHQETDDVHCFHSHVYIVNQVLFRNVMISAKTREFIKPLQNAFDPEQPRKPHRQPFSWHSRVQQLYEQRYDRDDIQLEISDKIVKSEVLLVGFPFHFFRFPQINALFLFLSCNFVLFVLRDVVAQISHSFCAEKCMEYICNLNYVDEHLERGCV